MRCLLMQAAPLLSSRASVTNGWRSLPAGDAKLGKPLSHGDVTPPADDACVVETLGRAESAMSAETAYFDAGYPCNYGASSVHCLDSATLSCTGSPPHVARAAFTNIGGCKGIVSRCPCLADSHGPKVVLTPACSGGRVHRGHAVAALGRQRAGWTGMAGLRQRF